MRTRICHAPPRRVQKNTLLRSSSKHRCQLPPLRGVSLKDCMSGIVWSMQTVKMGPHVPALSSTALPYLLDAIYHLWLGMPSPSEEAEPSEEHQDLLESLAVKEVPKPSTTKDAYQKFLDILEAWAGVWNPDPVPKPGNPAPNPTMGDLPIPPGQVDPPLAPGPANPPLIQGSPQVPIGSQGRFPPIRKSQRRCSLTEILCITIPLCLL